MYRLDSLSTIKNYYRWILDEFKPFIGKRVLEVGAGIGTFTNLILESEEIERFFLLEPSQELMDKLKNTFNDNPKIDFIYLCAEDITGETIKSLDIDTVIFVNVLEHIKDDVDILRKFSENMKKGSRILIFSPAFHLLYSYIDSIAGHYRRYTKKSLQKRLAAAGLKIIHLQYFNFIGFFTWLIFIKFLCASDFSKKGLKLYDIVIPYLQIVERLIRPPIGQNVMAICEVV